MSLKFLFRVDASIEMGSGHVMRCLTLANALKENGHVCTFICREHKGNMIEKIQSYGHTVFFLQYRGNNECGELAHSQWLGASQSTDVKDCIEYIEEVYDWLIVDHYALDISWEQQLRPYCNHIMVIDDLADRKHDCDLLLDQNLGHAINDYQDLVGDDCQILIGPQYALLRPEFSEWREYSLQRRAKQTEVKELLINLGGVDKDNLTCEILDALKNSTLAKDCHITVVMGATAPHILKVREKAEQLPWKTDVLTNVNNMAEIMAKADFAIGAAGSSSWERCCLGLPTQILVLAENQKKTAHLLEKIGCVIAISDTREIVFFGDNLDSNLLSNLSEKSSKLVDGLGSKKIRDILIEC